MPHFQHDGVDLFYLVEGYGEIILLLHSWTCDMHDWNYQIPMLVTRGFTTITADLRGHGRSSAPANNDYSIETLAADVMALIDHLGIKHFLIFGHSLGAVVGSVVAVNHHDMVNGMVLIDPSYYRTEQERANFVGGLQSPDSPEIAASLFARALYTPETPAHLKAWHMRRIRSLPAEVVSNCLAYMFGHGSRGLWENMCEFGKMRAGPRLVICTNHIYAQQEISLGMRELDRVEVISEGTWPHQQASEQCNSLIARWLDKCDLHG